MATNTPAPGVVYLHSSVELIKGGDYTARMTVESKTQGTLADESLPFTVGGERFTLAPGDFQLISPPPGSTSPVADKLPFAVFYRHSLPWEQAVDSAHPGAWVALLVLRQDELATAAAADKAVLVEGQTVANLLALPAGTLGPALAVSPDEGKQPCRWLDIGPTLFRQIAPSLDEIDLLAHVRQAGTDDKEPTGQDDDGWYAMVCANRLPSSDVQPTPHQAFLISVQGHAKAFADPSTVNRQSVRVLVLSSWAFRCASDGSPSFLSLAYGLSIGALGGITEGSKPLGQPASTPVPAHASKNTDGRVPVARTEWDGTVSRAWYRGPCSPIPVARDSTVPPLHVADQAIVPYQYVPGQFEPEITYASAFEVGRQLALADHTFVEDLIKWRKAGGDSLTGHIGAKTVGKLVTNEPLPLQGAADWLVSRSAVDWFAAQTASRSVARFRRIPRALTLAYTSKGRK
jgi:hypothetical protein